MHEMKRNLGADIKSVKVVKTDHEGGKEMEIKIYEKALCCESGLCGPSIDPELLRLTTVVRSLNKKGFGVRRYNLSMSPMEFTKNEVVANLLKEKGVEILPITVNGSELLKTGAYPTNEEFALWTGLQKEELEIDLSKVLTL